MTDTENLGPPPHYPLDVADESQDDEEELGKAGTARGVEAAMIGSRAAVLGAAASKGAGVAGALAGAAGAAAGAAGVQAASRAQGDVLSQEATCEVLIRDVHGKIVFGPEDVPKRTTIGDFRKFLEKKMLPPAWQLTTLCMEDVNGRQLQNTWALWDKAFCELI
eukprot:gnl/MRDRNA2_/MRDRNA2_130362_c0_seq1.p1 gnl/MRDRNA2_/MRDRNA2_130362_c0~~gnl/MRDRNA2_/MRDRNA2_130362_c0_seq1.p1  ORF type:complete len:164 (-),score=45.98 gnl/MRDRNA2_/MRDRNA2_130362_c0_seq1:1275-1766(-)